MKLSEITKDNIIQIEPFNSPEDKEDYLYNLENYFFKKSKEVQTRSKGLQTYHWYTEQDKESFTNGNSLIGMWNEWFALLDKDENVIKFINVYEPHNMFYNEKLNVIMIDAHETIHTVYEDGSFDKVHTR